MKIPLNKIDANPFRNIDKYPIDRDKVEALKESIQTTEFWDNVLVRKKGQRYELAYGHHRMVALRELKIKTIDVPVRKLDDATMLRIMAEENLDAWSQSAVVILETVRATKAFLDAELAKSDTWGNLVQMYQVLFDTSKAFDVTKGMGVGHDTIRKFLGMNWADRKIREALAQITAEKAGEIDREAAEVLPKMEHVREFRGAIKQIEKDTGKKVAPEKQRAVARQIRKAIDRDEIGSREVKQETLTTIGHKPPTRERDDLILPPDVNARHKNLLAALSDTTAELNKLYRDRRSLRAGQRSSLRKYVGAMRDTCDKWMKEL